MSCVQMCMPALPWMGLKLQIILFNQLFITYWQTLSARSQVNPPDTFFYSMRPMPGSKGQMQ